MGILIKSVKIERRPVNKVLLDSLIIDLSSSRCSRLNSSIGVVLGLLLEVSEGDGSATGGELFSESWPVMTNT